MSYLWKPTKKKLMMEIKEKRGTIILKMFDGITIGYTQIIWNGFMI